MCAYPVYVLQLLRLLKLAQCETDIIFHEENSKLNDVNFYKYKIIVYISHLITDYDLTIIKNMSKGGIRGKIICCTTEVVVGIKEYCREIILGDYRIKVMDVISKIYPDDYEKLHNIITHFSDKHNFPWFLRALSSYQVEYFPLLYPKEIIPCLYYHVNNKFDYTWFNYTKKFYHNKLCDGRKVEDVLDEIEWEQKKRIKINRIFFPDRCFNFDKGWLERFCQEKIKRGLNIPWIANMDIEKLDENQIKVLKEAKLNLITGNISHGFQDKLEKEELDYERLSKNINCCNQEKIRTMLFWEIGYPNDNKKSIENCFQKVIIPNMYNVDLLFISFANPLPGTLFYDYLCQKGELHKETYKYVNNNAALMYHRWVNIHKGSQSYFSTNYLSKEEVTDIFKNITLDLKTKLLKENWSRKMFTYLRKGVLKPHKGIKLVKNVLRR